MNKFKIGDTVKYDGKLRPKCRHDNEEFAKVLGLPNSARPYYLLGVLDYDGTPLKQTIYYVEHPVHFLIDGKYLELV